MNRPFLGRHSGVIDSHCHLQSLSRSERQAALEEARSRGVAGFLIPALRLEEADEILGLCHDESDVWCALGVHPHEASSWAPDHQRKLAELVRDPKVIAVGECGLDFFYDLSDRQVQVRALREQWEVALDHDLPAIVHNRESNEVMLELVRELRFEGLKADFHSFAGGLEMALELTERGCYLGFSGMVTFPRASNVREVLPRIPVDRVLVETDTPYLAPVPYRGKPNRPAYVVEVARRVAQELSLDFEEFCRLSTSNFRCLFPRAVSS